MKTTENGQLTVRISCCLTLKTSSSPQNWNWNWINADLSDFFGSKPIPTCSDPWHFFQPSVLGSEDLSSLLAYPGVCWSWISLTQSWVFSTAFVQHWLATFLEPKSDAEMLPEELWLGMSQFFKRVESNCFVMIFPDIMLCWYLVFMAYFQIHHVMITILTFTP